MRESGIHPKPIGQRSMGFTLLELLVAVALVVVVLSLLFPAFQKTRDRARSAQCMANLREIGTLLGCFLADKGYYPGAYVELNAAGNVTQRWFQVLRSYSHPNYSRSSMEVPKGMQCPSRKPATGVKALGYGYNFEGFGHTPENGNGNWDEPGKEYMRKYWQVKPGRVEEPAKKLVIGDSLDDGSTADITTRVIFIYRAISSPYHARRHDGGGNYLFADGHVEWLHVDELGKRVKEASPHPFYPF